jgi:hypothetical protein
MIATKESTGYEASGINTKKRKREEAFPMEEMTLIDQELREIKKRKLNNYFKDIISENNDSPSN